MAPELDTELVYATPSSLKEWCATSGPRTNVAAFSSVEATDESHHVSLQAMQHNGGVKTSVHRFAAGLAEGVC